MLFIKSISRFLISQFLSFIYFTSKGCVCISDKKFSQINIGNQLYGNSKIEQNNYSFDDKEILSTLSKARKLLSKIDDEKFTEKAEEYITDFEDGIKDKRVKPKIIDRIKKFCSKSKDYIGEHKMEACQFLMSAVQTYLSVNPPA